jgi:hypothetical protein
MFTGNVGDLLWVGQIRGHFGVDWSGTDPESEVEILGPVYPWQIGCLSTESWDILWNSAHNPYNYCTGCVDKREGSYVQIGVGLC